MAHFEFHSQAYPTAPGCYLMWSSGGSVLYVGKAINLRRRLASYFRPKAKGRRVRSLARKVAAVEVILVRNETESLILENTLIDRYRPTFNRMFWRADKGFPYIGLTNEPLPRLVPVLPGPPGGHREDPRLARRFGPYLNARFRDTVLDFVRDHFLLRTCDPLPSDICLRYHIHRCGGVCTGLVPETTYGQAVREAVTFLETRSHGAIIEEMRRQMWMHSEQLAFEQANRLKGQIEALESAMAEQVVQRDVPYDQHAVYFAENHALIAEMERGLLHRVCNYNLGPDGGRTEEQAAFLEARYRAYCPPELIVNRLPAAETVAERLTQRNGYAVRIVEANGQVHADLMTLCRLNLDYRVAQAAAPA